MDAFLVKSLHTADEAAQEFVQSFPEKDRLHSGFCYGKGFGHGADWGKSEAEEELLPFLLQARGWLPPCQSDLWPKDYADHDPLACRHCKMLAEVDAKISQIRGE